MKAASFLQNSVCYSLVFAVALFGAYRLWTAEPRATAEAVYKASEDAGFTHKQAVFLRNGPFAAVSLCLEQDLSEKVCSFLAEGSRSHFSDADFYVACDASGLSRRQCLLLREGVSGYRKSFGGSDK